MDHAVWLLALLLVLVAATAVLVLWAFWEHMAVAELESIDEHQKMLGALRPDSR